MPPRRPPRTPPRPLDQRLTLAMWFADQMGYADNLEMLLDLRERDGVAESDFCEKDVPGERGGMRVRI